MPPSAKQPGPQSAAPAAVEHAVRRGGTELVEVVAFRREGFNGEISVAAENLPPGVTARPIRLGPGQSVGTLVLSAADDAPESIALVNVRGRALVAAGELVRTARTATLVWTEAGKARAGASAAIWRWPSRQANGSRHPLMSVPARSSKCRAAARSNCRSASDAAAISRATWCRPFRSARWRAIAERRANRRRGDHGRA